MNYAAFIADPSQTELFDKALASVRRMAEDYAATQTAALRADLDAARRDAGRLREALHDARLFVAARSLGQSRTHHADALLKRIIAALAALAATAVRTDAVPGAPAAPSGMNKAVGWQMTVREARRRNVCRICGQPATAPLTLNYGDEFAHTACLSGTPAAPSTDAH